MATPRELLARAARDWPQRPMLLCVGGDGTLTVRSHAEVARRADEIAAALAARGLGSGSRVLLAMENTPTFFECWFGVMRAGAAAVCVSPRLTGAELAHVVADADPRLAVVDPRVLPALGEAAAGPGQALEVVAEPDAGSLTGGPVPRPPHGDAAPALVLYTSGSTSRPKGVQITARSLGFAADRMRESLPLTPDDRSLVSLPVSHINALAYSTMPALATGATLVVMQRFSARQWFDVACAHGATVASLSTAALRILLARTPDALERTHRLRTIGCGARWREVEERFGVSTVGWYGMTETVIPPLVTPPGAPFGSCGTVARGYEVRLGPDGALLVRGERGQAFFTGYIGGRHERFDQEGWFETGDRLRRDDQGHHYFVARDADILRIGGENVAAPEIERALQADPRVLDAAVVGEPDRILGEVPVAFVALRAPPIGGPEALVEELLALCRRSLAPWKVPRRIELREELPRVTLDKIDKRALRAEVGCDPAG